MKLSAAIKLKENSILSEYILQNVKT